MRVGEEEDGRQVKSGGRQKAGLRVLVTLKRWGCRSGAQIGPDSVS